MLFTHWGISGPGVLKLSAFAAVDLFKANYNFTIRINLLPQYNTEKVKEKFQDMVQYEGRKKVGTYAMFELPKRCWQMLLLKSQISEEKNWADLNKQQKENLLKCLTALELQVSGKSTFKEEFVTCGGISLSEIDVNTMQSKLVPGLFFAGEVMDVDGITGGFNFQHAWTSGWIAAKSIASL